MKYRLLLLKRWIEDVMMSPFILLGRIIAHMKPLEREYETFFFFPFYHIGGAEKVHLNIAQAVGGKDCIIFFTRKSHNDLFYAGFASSGCVIKDISKYTDNKWIYFANVIFRGIVSGYINGQKKTPLVFNGQCNFGYKLSPWISKRIPQVELIHSLCSFSYIRIPFLPFITRTVMISKIRIAEHIALYGRYGIPAAFESRIQFILNGIELPQTKPLPKVSTAELVCLYVGRATPEKRVHLIAEMAKRINEKKAAIHFQFLGDVKEAIPEALWPYCKFWGAQSNDAVIDKIYSEAHVLLLVSDTEGFPMVVMEAMAKGLAILATSVGEIPLHVKEGVNGFLINDYTNERGVIEKGTEALLHLEGDKKLLPQISAANITYAFNHFGMTRFRAEYRQLFEQMRQQKIEE